LKARIPFEVHITIEDLLKGEEQTFIKFCKKQNAKPLLIELDRGEFVKQPMYSKVIHSVSLEEVLNLITEDKKIFDEHNLKVRRVKIEIPFNDSHLIDTGNFPAYFEWHGKVIYQNSKSLLQLCKEHKAHLSSNALKEDNSTRFVTLRENDKEKYKQRVDTLIEDLKSGGWNISKNEWEFCIYDTNILLDNGWLPN
jgi:hypothetical protein